jgi:hypothetical protein
MSISSHTGIVLLILIGMTTVIGLIVIAMIEAKRADSGKSSIIPGKNQPPADNKKGK